MLALMTWWAWAWPPAPGSKVGGVHFGDLCVSPRAPPLFSRSPTTHLLRLDATRSHSCFCLTRSLSLAAILSSLRQADDESAQVGALTELCEALSISTEDTLASFPIESCVPILVRAPVGAKSCVFDCARCSHTDFRK